MRERLKGLNTNPFQWAERNIDAIEANMRKVRDMIYQSAIGEGDYAKAKKYDPESLALSEMPLCGSLNIISPPSGYQVVGSSVIYPDAGVERRREHWFYAGLKSKIICLTPGQFVLPSDKLEKGKRLEILEKKAPDLVFILNKEIAVLAGDRDEIFSILELNYLLEKISISCLNQPHLV